MFGRSISVRKFTPSSGLDATAEEQRARMFHILMFRFGRRIWQNGWSEGRMSGRVLRRVDQ